MSLLAVAGANSASGGYNVDNSGVWESDSSMRMYRTLGTPTNVDKATFSFWFKRSELGRQFFFSTRQNTSSPYDTFRVYITSDDELSIQNYTTSYNARIETNAVFRDTAAWYHIVASIDTTLSTSGDRFRLYINGVEDDSFSAQDQPLQNSDLFLGSGRIMEIGRFVADNGGSSYECEGYMAEAHFIDGQQLAPTEFGEFDEDSGIWKPKQYTGTYGNNGHYLQFKDSTAMGTDTSGNGNNFTADSTATAPSQSTDTCTNNFCTMNTNFKTSSSIVVSEGQTKVTCGSGTGWLSNVGTIALTKGKWYWELASVTSVYQIFGIADASDDKIPQAAGGYYVGYGSNDTTLSVGMYMINGQFYGNQDGGSGVGIASGAVGDIFGVCLDLDNLGFYITRNGVSPSGSDPTSGSSLTGAATWNDSIYSGYYYPAVSVFQGNGLEMNFGGYTSNPIASAATDANGYGNFEYAPPSGYYAICTKNIAEYG